MPPRNRLHVILIGTALLFSGLTARAQHFGFFGDKNYLWDSIQFTEPRDYLFLDTSSANLWQIGQPAKFYFDSAYSASRAIVTDTLLPYPSNASSYFELVLPIIEFEGIGGAGIIFSYKIDSDTLKDGGYITVSFDKGATWCNIATFDPSCFETGGEFTFSSENPFEFDSLHNGELGFSGQSLDWNKIEFGWWIQGVKGLDSGLYSDTLKVRFHFTSDSTDNPGEGWMIDDIFLYGREYPGGLSQQSANRVELFPNPNTGTFQVSLKQPAHQLRARLFSASGTLVAEQFCSVCSEMMFQQAGLAPGLYFLSLEAEHKTFGYSKVFIK